MITRVFKELVWVITPLIFGLLTIVPAQAQVSLEAAWFVSWMGQHNSASHSAIALNGQILVVPDGGGWMRLYDTRTGASFGTWRAHPSYVEAIGVCRSNDFIATCSSNMARIWSVPAMQLLLEFSYDGTAYSSAFTPNGALLAIAHYTSTTVYDIETGAVITSIPIRAYDVTFINDELMLALTRSAEGHESGQIVNIRTGETVMDYGADSLYVKHAILSGNEKYILLMMYTLEPLLTQVHVYDVEANKIVWRMIPGDTAQPVSAYGMTNSGNTFFITRSAQTWAGSATEVIQWKTNDVMTVQQPQTIVGARLVLDSSLFITNIFGPTTDVFGYHVHWGATSIEREPDQKQITCMYGSAAGVSIHSVRQATQHLSWSIFDLSGQWICEGVVARTGNSFHLEPAILPDHGVFLLRASDNDNTIGTWKISL